LGRGKDWGRERRKGARREKWRGKKWMEGKVKPLPNKNSGYGLE